WGDNTSGELGDGTNATRPTAAAVPALTGITQLAAGNAFTCARLQDGTVDCWGKNNHGQLGDGTTTDRNTPAPVAGLSGAVEVATTDRSTPVPVPGLASVAQLTAGEDFTCARLADRTVRCWGFNLTGELGDGTIATRTAPVPVTGITSATQITAGRLTACALL